MPAYNNLASSLTELGRHVEALTARLDGARLAHRFGLMRTREPTCWRSAAESLVWLGRWEEADHLFEEVFELDLPASEMLHALLARAYGSLCRGDLDAARTDLAQITAGSASTPDPRSAAVTCILHAQLAIAEGRLADARRAVSDGLAALASSIDPALVVELCSAGMAAEAGTAERARALQATTEHEDAVPTRRRAPQTGQRRSERRGDRGHAVHGRGDRHR